MGKWHGTYALYMVGRMLSLVLEGRRSRGRPRRRCIDVVRKDMKVGERRRQMETSDSLWQALKGKQQKEKRKTIQFN